MSETTDIAIRADQERMDGKQLAYIANTEFVPKSYRGNIPAIMACVQTGRELGIGDLEALRSIHVIDGKPTLSAELMVKLARKRGHSVNGEFGDGSVTVTGTRKDNGDSLTVTWTMGMAQRAGLVGKDNWKKYPESMLWARAASQLCRMLFPDVLSGVSYTAEEATLSDEERIAQALDSRVPVEAPPDDGVIDVEAVEDSEGEPQADATPSGDHAVSSAAASEPASPSEETEPSLFEAQAVAAQQRRARETGAE